MGDANEDDNEDLWENILQSMKSIKSDRIIATRFCKQIKFMDKQCFVILKSFNEKKFLRISKYIGLIGV